MKVTRLKSGGFISSGTDAGDLNILRSAKNIDDGSYNGMRRGGPVKIMKKGGKAKSRVNEAGNYTKPGMRKKIFNRIKEITDGKGAEESDLFLDLPEIAENGNQVKVSFEIDSPMTKKDHVKEVHILADGNPAPNVAMQDMRGSLPQGPPPQELSLIHI